MHTTQTLIPSSVVLSPQELAARPGTFHLALPVYDKVPEGCFAVEIEDDCNDPYLRQGEFAIVNPDNCDAVHGELYYITMGCRAGVMQMIWHGMAGVEYGNFMPMNRPESLEELAVWMATGRPLYSYDGQIKPQFVRKRILGHVIGFMEDPDVSPYPSEPSSPGEPSDPLPVA